MKRSILSSFCALAFIGLLYVPAAVAQPTPEWTTWTITEPTQVGDVVLQPGTYQLKITTTPTNRNFVRVMSQDMRELLTTALTVPHAVELNEKIPENATFIYYPAIEGQPRVLRSWFPSGVSIGHDFVYEEEMATRLARANTAPVVSYRGTVSEADLGNTELHVVTPEARVETYTVPETTTKVTTVTEERPVAVAESRVNLEDRSVAAERTELPATAGSTPLVALLGLVAIAGAVAIRFMNR